MGYRRRAPWKLYARRPICRPAHTLTWIISLPCGAIASAPAYSNGSFGRCLVRDAERITTPTHLAPVKNRVAPAENRLLASMSAETFNHLRPHLQRVPLRRREILQERNRPLQYVHFIERGVASLFARTSRDGPVEVAMIGRLGLVGIPVVLGTMHSPNRCLVQVPGEALRMASEDLRQAIDACVELRQQLMNYCSGSLDPKFTIRIVQCPPRAARATVPMAATRL